MDSGAPSYQRLLLPWRPVEVQRQLEERLRRPVALAVTANRSRLVRVLPEAGRTSVRLHAMFLYAPGPVLEALARYARRPHDVEANDVLDAFIRGEAHRVEGVTSVPTAAHGPESARTDSTRPDESSEPTRARGERYDLQEIMDDLNARFFGSKVRARITWSKGVVQRRRRSILFGSYQREPGRESDGSPSRHGLIKIHPALDEEWVPRGFVEFVVHHELLHAVIPTRIVRGRRAFHPPEFRQRERLYPGYKQWRLWEKENLGRFLGKTSFAPALEVLENEEDDFDEDDSEVGEWFAPDE